jgi:hypothetical protein
MKMKAEENATTCLLHVEGIVKNIIGLGEIVTEPTIVQKVLRSLPLIFNSKVFAIEEIKDIGPLEMDELHGILTAYEMKVEKEKP